MARIFRDLRLFGSRLVTQIAFRKFHSAEIYPQLKENIQMLVGNDPQTAITKLDEIGYSHLNNIRQFELEAVAEGDKKKKLAETDKFPINENQMLHMLSLILDSETLEDPMNTAVYFSKLMVQTNLTKLNDNWLKVLIGTFLKRRANSPLTALKAYEDLCEYQPYPKIFPTSIFMIMSAMRGKKDQKIHYKRALGVLEKQGSKHPHYIESAVMLANGEALPFLDQLKNENRSLGPDDLRKLSQLASQIKEPKILEPLVQLYRILPNHRDACLELFNTLANLYGQKRDFESLEVLWRSLKEQIRRPEKRYYRHVFQRCRHYYKCNNMRTPDDLYNLLEDLGDY